MKNPNNQSGFTLIEILIVVAILGILAAVAAFSVSAMIVRSNLSAANTEAQNVHIAAVACRASAGDWPSRSDRPEFTTYFHSSIRAIYHFDETNGLVESVESVADGWPTSIEFNKTEQRWEKR